MGCHGFIAIARRLDDESGISGTQVYVLLRKRNGNSMLAEHLVDLQQQIMGSSRPILWTRHKARDFPLPHFRPETLIALHPALEV